MLEQILGFFKNVRILFIKCANQLFVAFLVYFHTASTFESKQHQPQPQIVKMSSSDEVDVWHPVSNPNFTSFSYIVVTCSISQALFVCTKPKPCPSRTTLFMHISLNFRTRPVFLHVKHIQNNNQGQNESLTDDFIRERADSGEFFVFSVCFNSYRNPGASDSAMQSLASFVQFNTSTSMHLLDPCLLLLLARSMKSYHNLTVRSISFIKVCHLLCQHDERRGYLSLQCVFLNFFSAGTFNERNDWMGTAIREIKERKEKNLNYDEMLDVIIQMCEINAYLSKCSEMLVTKFPPHVLDFLMSRIQHLLDALHLSRHHRKCTLVLFDHLALLLNYSEFRWKFRQVHGIIPITMLMETYCYDKDITIRCCDTLNTVATGIFKRKIKIFKRKAKTYKTLVNFLVSFKGNVKIIGSICSFFGKVIEYCPGDVEYLQLANTRAVVEDIKLQ